MKRFNELTRKQKSNYEADANEVREIITNHMTMDERGKLFDYLLESRNVQPDYPDLIYRFTGEWKGWGNYFDTNFPPSLGI